MSAEPKRCITVTAPLAGLAVLVISAGITLIRKPAAIVATLVVAVVVMFTPVADFIAGRSLTIERLEKLRVNTVEQRIGVDWFAKGAVYSEVHGPRILLVGGGFYAVPLRGLSGELKYRVGYGVHNIHLFPLEQAGLAGFFAGIYFWFCVFRESLRHFRDDVLAYGGAAFGLAIASVGWAGQIFYFGFGTVNMVVAQVMFMALAISGFTSPSKQKPKVSAARRKPRPRSSVQSGWQVRQ